MKKTDVAMIILIAAVVMFISYAIANKMTFLKPPDKGQTVKVVDSISPTVSDPDPKVFNKDAINPTVRILIGGENQ